MRLSGWGRYPVLNTNVATPRDIEEIRQLLKNDSGIARGNGRAYGDSAVSNVNTIHMKHFNKMISFDPKNGILVAEAGVLLSDVIQAFLSRGWFPYVTPGTKFVTLGGMVAADVHGKNHHKEGTFGNYVKWIEVLTSDGEVKRCSRKENPELFEWTLGGMGLTGIILSVAFRLRPVSSAWIEQRTLAADNITHAINLFEELHDATYSVAWIDCLQTGVALGRSLIITGEHAEDHLIPSKYLDKRWQIPSKRKIEVPDVFPNWFLNRYSVKLLNSLYYWRAKRRSEPQIIDYDSFFYPLDTILGWNKGYGQKGFAQFQCVFSLKQAEQALTALLEAVSAKGEGSFLAVLKRFGPQKSKFSFPMEGYTLALDFPINDNSLALMRELDDITLQYNGRMYLAKDSRMSRDVFEKSETRADEFRKYRKGAFAAETFNSAQSDRLGL